MKSPSLSRRDVLRRIGYGVAAVPLLHACSSSGDDPLADGGADAIDAGPAVDADPSAPDAAGGWARGGTVAMTDKDTYPDPFTRGLATCAIVAATTEGPCTTANDLDREDVSEGWTGLPVRLALKVVDSACEPLPGVVVKIWHTNLAGVYSGDTPSPALCSSNDQAAISMDFFRGVRTTDEDGVVYVDTCYPGWYGGRAIHIHFQVESGNTSYRISQLFFPESLTAEIFAEHPEYQPFGQPDRTFATDGVMAAIPSSERARLVFDTARMSDGAMLASKIVTVKS